jgi:hypothetical protein
LSALPVPATETTPEPAAAPPAVSAAPVTVAPWASESWPKPASPTISEPATRQLEPAPETLTEELDAEPVLAMVALAEVVTVPPELMARLPTPASPTMKRPVLVSNDLVPVTVAVPLAPAFCAMSTPSVAGVGAGDGGALVLDQQGALAAKANRELPDGEKFRSGVADGHYSGGSGAASRSDGVVGRERGAREDSAALADQQRALAG